MRTIATAVLFALPLFAAGVHAEDKPMGKQQSRMAQCNHEATGKKGDERRQFMSKCLKGEIPDAKSNAKGAKHETRTLKRTETKPEAPVGDAAAKEKSQPSKLADCNKQAEGMKGDERKKFMSECLGK